MPMENTYLATDAFDGVLYPLARKFFEDRGVAMPLAGTPAGDVAYRLWAKWALSNVDLRSPAAEAAALQEIEVWIHEELDGPDNTRP